MLNIILQPDIKFYKDANKQFIKNSQLIKLNKMEVILMFSRIIKIIIPIKIKGDSEQERWLIKYKVKYFKGENGIISVNYNDIAPSISEEYNAMMYRISKTK